MKKMKKSILIIFTWSILGFYAALWAKTNVVTSYPFIADLVQRIGGSEVSVRSLAKATRDPHFITPKPSFIAKLRKADLLVISGGQLEIGWLPAVIRRSNRANIQPGKTGFMALFDLVKPIQVQTNVSRAHGDVHPEGNPHIQLDPNNIPLFAEAITARLCALEPAQCEAFKKNLEAFKTQWQTKLTEWETGMAKLKGEKIVSYHKLFDYFFHHYGLELVGTLEPLPGIPPTPKHIGEIIALIKQEKVNVIIQDVYHNSKTARFAAKKTGAKMVIVPHDVGAVKEVEDIISLFDEIVRRLTGS